MMHQMERARPQPQTQGLGRKELSWRFLATAQDIEDHNARHRSLCHAGAGAPAAPAPGRRLFKGGTLRLPKHRREAA